MPKLQYVGGVQAVDVVLPTRVLSVAAGDVIDVTADEAARLADHPDFVAPAKRTATPSEEN